MTKASDIYMGRGITDILAFVQEIYTVSRGSIRASKLAATSNNLTPGPWRDSHKNADVHPLFLAANLDLQNNFARMFKTRGQKLHHRPRFLRALFRPRNFAQNLSARKMNSANDCVSRVKYLFHSTLVAQ